MFNYLIFYIISITIESVFMISYVGRPRVLSDSKADRKKWEGIITKVETTKVDKHGVDWIIAWLSVASAIWRCNCINSNNNLQSCRKIFRFKWLQTEIRIKCEKLYSSIESRFLIKWNQNLFLLFQSYQKIWQLCDCKPESNWKFFSIVINFWLQKTFT